MDIKEKQQIAPKPCCCIWEYKYIAAPEVYLHHPVSVARYLAHSHSCDPFVSVSTSLPTFPRRTQLAMSSSSKLSPLPPPCQHTVSTTPHNSETSLTFSPTSRNSRYNRVELLLGNKDGINSNFHFLEDDNTWPSKMLPLPCCLQSSVPDSRSLL